MSRWYVYILECRDKTLYTGMTNDLDARLEKHLTGHGAKYTRSRGVKRLLYSERFKSKSRALRREREIKALSRKEKLHLIMTARR